MSLSAFNGSPAAGFSLCVVYSFRLSCSRQHAVFTNVCFYFSGSQDLLTLTFPLTLSHQFMLETQIFDGPFYVMHVNILLSPAYFVFLSEKVSNFNKCGLIRPYFPNWMFYTRFFQMFSGTFLINWINVCFWSVLVWTKLNLGYFLKM